MSFDTIVVPHINVNDVEVLLVEWHVDPWSRVDKGALICTIESTKAVITMESPKKGFVYPVVKSGNAVPVGQPLAHIFPSGDRSQISKLQMSSEGSPNITITKKARELMDKFGFKEMDFPLHSNVSSDTVVAKIRERQAAESNSFEFSVPNEIILDSKSIVLFGDFNQALMALDAIEARGDLKAIAMIQDSPKATDFYGLPSLSFCALEPLAKRGLKKAFFCLSDSKTNERAIRAAAEFDIEPVTIVHPSASISQRSRIGQGAFVGPLASVGPEVDIGEFSRILCGSTIAHHSKLGRYVSVSDGAHLAGNVQVDDFALIGIGVTINRRVHIGCRSIIVSGAVVTDNVPADYIFRLDGMSVKKPNLPI